MPKKLLLLAKNWPEPNSTAAGRRTLDLLSIFLDQGYQVHVASAAENTPFQADLSKLGIHCHKVLLNDASFDSWITALSPTEVIFDRFVTEEQFGWRVKSQCPEAMTLLDTSDFHALRQAREVAFKQLQPVDLYSELAIRELSAMVRCDLTLMISEIEISLLQQQFGLSAGQLVYLPFFAAADDIQPGPSFDQRKHVVMIGGFKHEPNRDATRWLKQEIWPQLKSLLPNDCELHVYGAYADHAMNQLHNPKQRFFIKGRAVDALTTLAQYRVNLAPLRFGAGQKGKIFEGWLTGTPTVTTAVGAESMADASQLGYPLTDKTQQVAEIAAQAYNDSGYWQTLQQNGFTLLDTGFNKAVCVTHFWQQYSNTFAHLEQHRAQNFWGRVLWQNQHRATEYMSRWIEAKNHNRVGSSATD
ncbi:glycosyltransferase [Reinekea sp. G2M2-21]|uniref:glycosyltransferase n=1 Tax=Reinekea sp. G2M2-21 TaxID=2788942 RepID=UPI0018A92087|nr:glycosyltransferase [Reinekea sp. G2M2-21]